MATQSPYVLTMGIAIGLLVGISVPRSQVRVAEAAPIVDAAFRDGVFQAKLDLQNARKPHLMAGRWNSNADRALFIAGYKQVYNEPAAASGKLARPNAAELAGYGDGISDGAVHRAAAQQFQGDKTSNFRKGGQIPEITAPSALSDYRLAYMNGYQLGYYAQEKSPEWSYYSPEKHKEVKTASGKAAGSIAQP
jgi:hypothetical protein